MATLVEKKFSPTWGYKKRFAPARPAGTAAKFFSSPNAQALCTQQIVSLLMSSTFFIVEKDA